MSGTVSLPASLTGRFQIVRPLSRGAYGWVFEADQLDLKRTVALKLLHAERMEDPQIVSRFKAEARVTAQLAHPHIVRILDADVADGVPWIAYELLSGGTLADAISEKAMPWDQALTAGVQVAQALERAHAAGVLHRDIKARNVLAAGDGLWKVTDFGLAKFSSERTIQTADGTLMGTPGYMAPELARGEAASPATDVYALGVLLYELLSGGWPFNGTSGIEILRKHLTQAPAPLAPRVKGLPPSAEAAVMQALAKTPDARIPTARALRAALEAALVDGGIAPPSDPSSAVASKPSGPAPRPRSVSRSTGRTAAISRPPDPPRSMLPLALAVGAGAFGVALLAGLWLIGPAPAPSPSASAVADTVPRAERDPASLASAAASPATSAPAVAAREAVPPVILQRARTRAADLRDGRNAIRFSFGDLIEKTADNDSFLGLSPAELASHLDLTDGQFAQHRRLRDGAQTLLAELRAAIRDPEAAATGDLLVLIQVSSLAAIETVEILRYEKLQVVLRKLKEGGGGKRLEDTLQGLKTVCYPPEVLATLARHAELAAIVLERAAQGEVHPDYPSVFDALFQQSFLFTSYTVCGMAPAEVVRRCEERILTRLTRLSTPAAKLLAALTADLWRTRSQVEPTTARRRATSAVAEIARLSELHPQAAASYRRVAQQLARFTR